MLVPPQLPPFLAAMFDLKSIVDVPNTEEVKLVHAAIRALGSYLHTPELRDSSLPIDLNQHLFDIQMACYRARYPVGIFPNEVVYTPPSLPAHIPVNLEPVVGPPSDDEIRSVYTAIRVSDSLSTNIASLFDADLNMQLSQHMFDLQLARHIHRSTRLQSTDRGALQQPNSTRAGAQDSSMATGPDEIPGADTGVRQGGTSPSGRPHPNNTQHSGTTQQDEPPMVRAYRGKNEPQESPGGLVEIREVLKDVIKVLVASQNSLARGFNSCRGYTGFNLGAHSLINDKGETPEMYALPTAKGPLEFNTSSFAQNLSTNVLARYLQFYGIGNEMITEGGLDIKSGMESDAKRLLTERVGIRMN